jgi:hypothetical protein
MNEIANSKNPLTWDVFAAKRRVATRDLGECALQNLRPGCLTLRAATKRHHDPINAVVGSQLRCGIEARVTALWHDASIALG